MEVNGFDLAYQVKQYVAVLQDPITRCRFMVFRTGEASTYLFSQLYPDTLTATGLQFPVRAKDLKPPYHRALAHGWGNAL